MAISWSEKISSDSAQLVDQPGLKQGAVGGATAFQQ
jgi:hypothetical protein